MSAAALARPRLRLKLGASLCAAAVLAAAAWLVPFDATKPVVAWFPGKTRLNHTLLVGLDVTPDVRLIGVHRPDLVVLQANDPWFAVKLLLAGAIPFSEGASPLLCRVQG